MIALTAVIIFIAVSASLIIHFSQGETTPPYSSYSVQPNGTKAAYLLLDSLDFNVSRLENSIDNVKDNSVIILVQPDVNDLTKDNEIEKINEWVSKGNTAVLAGNYNKYFVYSKDKDKFKKTLKSQMDNGDKDYYDIEYGKGKFRLIKNWILFVNSGLREDGNGEKFVSMVWNLKDKPVYFYEYKPEQGLSNSSSWSRSSISLLSTTERFILLQAVLGFIVLLFFTRRRLGLPLEYLDEKFRKENEDISALAVLMNKAGLENEALQLYYEKFTDEASSFFKVRINNDYGMIESLWQERKIHHYDDLKKVNSYMYSVEKGEKIPDNMFIKLFDIIDKLREELKRK